MENITILECLIFIVQQLFEDDISVIFDKYSSIKCLCITKNVVNASVVNKLLIDGEPLIVRKHLVDFNPLSVGKHLVDTKHLASMLAELTYLTYLPDLTIYEKLNNL